MMIPNISPSSRLGVLTLIGSSGLNPWRGLLPPPPLLLLDKIFLRLSAGLWRPIAINGGFQWRAFKRTETSFYFIGSR